MSASSVADAPRARPLDPAIPAKPVVPVAPVDRNAAGYAPPGINPWVIALIVTIATFMEILDTSIANVSLPHIAGSLGTDQNEATWVLTSYLVANAVVLPLSAWLSRLCGRKNFYMGCVALFTMSSFLCGIAPNLGVLIFCRVLQGVGGGGLAPSEQAILVDTFPAAKRAGAFALYSMAIVTAPAIGPPLGGWITDNFSWRWVFLINIPVGLFSLFLSSQFVHDPPEFAQEVREARRSGWLKVDYIGIVLVALGLGCLEVVLDKGQEDDWFGSPFIVFFFTVSMMSIVLLVIWEWFQEEPVVDLHLLRERNFALSCAFYLLFGAVIFGTTVQIPQLLQSLYGYTAQSAGEVLTPGALVIVFLAPVVVKILPKIGAARMIGAGFAVTVLSMWHFTHFSLASTSGDYVRGRMFQAFGLALMFVPVTQVAYSYLPKGANNRASSLTNLFRNLGGSLGIAFVTTMLTRRSQYHQNMLVEHISANNPIYRERLAGLTDTLVHAGLNPVAAAARAQGLIGRQLQQQATILSYLDNFWLLGAVATAGIILAFFIKPFKTGKGAGAH